MEEYGGELQAVGEDCAVQFEGLHSCSCVAVKLRCSSAVKLQQSSAMSSNVPNNSIRAETPASKRRRHGRGLVVCSLPRLLPVDRNVGYVISVGPGHFRNLKLFYFLWLQPRTMRWCRRGRLEGPIKAMSGWWS